MTLALMLQLLGLVFQLVYLMQGCCLHSQHYALLAAGVISFVAGTNFFFKFILGFVLSQVPNCFLKFILGFVLRLPNSTGQL
jgi:hypothetical protein